MAPAPLPTPHGPPPDLLQPRAVPQQKRSVERRQAILNAALALLRTHSPQSITTSLIAAEACVPVSSLYAYFPNKESVLAELMRDALEEVDNQLEELLPGIASSNDTAATIDALINVVLAGYRAVPERRMLFAGMRGDPRMETVLRASDARMVATVRANITRLRPEIPPPLAAAVAETAVRAFTALQDNAVLCEDPAHFDLLVQEWRRMMTAYLAGAGLAGESLPPAGRGSAPCIPAGEPPGAGLSIAGGPFWAISGQS